MSYKCLQLLPPSLPPWGSMIPTFGQPEDTLPSLDQAALHISIFPCVTARPRRWRLSTCTRRAQANPPLHRRSTLLQTIRNRALSPSTRRGPCPCVGCAKHWWKASDTDPADTCLGKILLMYEDGLALPSRSRPWLRRRWRMQIRRNPCDFQLSRQRNPSN